MHFISNNYMEYKLKGLNKIRCLCYNFYNNIIRNGNIEVLFDEAGLCIQKYKNEYWLERNVRIIRSSDKGINSQIKLMDMRRRWSRSMCSSERRGSCT